MASDVEPKCQVSQHACIRDWMARKCSNNQSAWTGWHIEVTHLPCIHGAGVGGGWHTTDKIPMRSK